MAPSSMFSTQSGIHFITGWHGSSGLPGVYVMVKQKLIATPDAKKKRDKIGARKMPENH